MGDISRGEGRTVLFVSHNMAAVRNLCNKGIVLKNGQFNFSGTAAQCVDQYGMLQTDGHALNKTNIQFDNSFRKYSNTHNRIVDFVSLELINNETIQSNAYASDQPIQMRFTILGKKSVNNFRIAGGVNTMEDQAVGVFFGEQNLVIKENEEIEVYVSLNNHQLAKGTYYMDFSIGIGDHTQGITDFDHVHQAFFFEIAYTDAITKEMIPLWSSSWGNINFQHVEIVQK